MSDCPYCDPPEPATGGWVHSDEHWLVAHGPAETTMAGALRVTSRRHYTDFAEMTRAEAESFGRLLTRLDAALRAVTDAERVHAVSTRDRVQHFHAWLYPRPASHPLRGTDFLNAPQRTTSAEAERTAAEVRAQLTTQHMVAGE
ncbi:diadenosine tetraphosphate (Ap4A) HIT family hydrolase [Saccharothrix coeruleofusca]|uniref:HIT family protein n=1 Tax=Saccharothrix coeruleofusca TaxID=33919 RepID=UPI001AE5F632|nr:hypothetical protein [Saccharothrix coeruleofusca]MBP2338213.1 diadenosine tetraphosphate (Ap4A) HIT family hydrolase [Saccharothrix coeruleofusca]